MNLPEMLRREAVVAYISESEYITHEEQIEDELAALVEDHDALIEELGDAHSECDCDLCAALRRCVASRAALVAKIGGKR